MERSALLVGLALAAFAVVAGEFEDEGWQRVKEGDGVVVYKRDVADSPYDESLAQTSVTTRLSAAVALITDGDNLAQWVDTVTESRTLETVSPTQAYTYTVSGAPWPIKDRDAIALSRVEQDEATLVVTIHSAGKPDYIEERQGMVRVSKVESTWTLTPQPGGVVAITFRVHHEPGGDLPSWLINSLVTDQPYKTLRNLRALLEHPNVYQDATLAFIREP